MVWQANVNGSKTNLHDNVIEVTMNVSLSLPELTRRYDELAINLACKQSTGSVWHLGSK